MKIKRQYTYDQYLEIYSPAIQSLYYLTMCWACSAVPTWGKQTEKNQIPQRNSNHKIKHPPGLHDFLLLMARVMVY